MFFRCTFIFTEAHFKDTQPSNIFLRAPSKDIAETTSKQIWSKKLIEYGIPQAEYNQEVIEVSEEEIAEYARAKVSGSNSNRMIN